MIFSAARSLKPSLIKISFEAKLGSNGKGLSKGFAVGSAIIDEIVKLWNQIWHPK